MLHTQVYKQGPTRFNMCGQVTRRPLHEVEEGITQGLASRLHRYAERELIAQGFGAIAAGATVTVYTIDGSDKPADRSYCVRWHTPQGGYVEMVEILTRAGWPCVDCGFVIGFQKR